jgi:hypothetical protein
MPTGTVTTTQIDQFGNVVQEGPSASLGGSCSGQGVPCYATQSGPLNYTVGLLPDGGYGVSAEYIWTVRDVYGDPAAVDSVSESLTAVVSLNADPNPTETTWTRLNGLDDSGLFFPDTLELAYSSSTMTGASLVFQTFIATVGGNQYPLLNQNTLLLAYGPGGPTGSIGIASSWPPKP